jgi:hypothetical protein
LWVQKHVVFDMNVTGGAVGDRGSTMTAVLLTDVIAAVAAIVAVAAAIAIAVAIL